MELKNRALRDIYVDLLMEYAKKYPELVIVEADLSKALATTRFFETYPNRAINVGVAEANMIGVAAGLANMGKIPFTHTFTPFATRRVYDQVNLSVAYSRLNVKMVGSDPGIMAQLNGGTHMSLEDVGIMRTMPTMTIVEPIDGVELAGLFPQILKHDGPVYIRLTRKDFAPVYEVGEEFILGKAKVIKKGNDVSIFASGIEVSEALEAKRQLEKKGISASVIDIHTIKPLDKETIIEEAKRTGAVVTAENHNIINGLGSAVAEVLVENCPVPMERVGCKDHFGEVGKKYFLM
ncbi:MAG: transketolase C-terminal domain-containing protein, partial [Sphaerochaetaceae bacterium]|nr:transketolase C-terminal domain-containing protein [Sphaerochaetaceae bacterium]